jgi:alpha-galactosidase
MMNYRPERTAPVDAFQGEGLLAVQPSADRAVLVVAAVDGREAIPSIRAEARGDRLAVVADGPVDIITDDGPGGIDGALARWADGFAARMGVSGIRRAPTAWCSWYQYFMAVTEADILENLDAIDHLELPIEVVQLDDGYEAEIGDWLQLSDRFASLRDLVGRVRSAGRRAGLWVAPFLVGARSQLAATHPDWLVGAPGQPVDAGYNWDQDLYALDTTHPGARAYLAEAFGTFHTWGINFFKIDFTYAGAIPGRRHEEMTAVAAYRSGVRLIREAICRRGGRPGLPAGTILGERPGLPHRATGGGATGGVGRPRRPIRWPARLERPPGRPG